MDQETLLRQLQEAKDREIEVARELDASRIREEELSRKVQELQEQSEDLYNQTTEAHEELDDVKRKLQGLEQDKGRLGRELAQLGGVHDKAAKDNTALKENEEKLRESLDTQRAERDDLDLQLKANKQQLKGLLSDNNSLRKELKTTQAHVEERQTLVDTLRAEVDAADVRILELETQVQEGEDAQKSLNDWSHELDDALGYSGTNLTMNDYLMHIRNLQNTRLYRDASEASFERAPAPDHSRPSRPRQVSVADELQDFDMDQENSMYDDTAASYEVVSRHRRTVSGQTDVSVEDFVSRHHRTISGQTDVSMEDPEETPRKTSGSRLSVVRETNGQYSPSRTARKLSKLRYSQNIDARLTDEEDASTNGHADDSDRSSTAEEPRTDASSLFDDLFGTGDTNGRSVSASALDFINREVEEMTSFRQSMNEENSRLQQHLEATQSENQRLRDQLDAARAELLAVVDELDAMTDEPAVVAEPAEKESTLSQPVVLDSPTTPANSRLPWIMAGLAAFLALYFALLYYDDRTRSLWANGATVSGLPRRQAPGAWQKKFEELIRFDRTRLG